MITPRSIRCSKKRRRINRRPSFLQKEKQIDYILTKRRYLRNVKDAEANDMIHMGSDHRCIHGYFLDQHAREGHPCQEGNQKTRARNNAAAAKDESTLAEAEAQGTERKSMESSSTEVNLRGVPAQPEHRRQDGWTSTRGSVEVKRDSDPDTIAGERLQKQRPHPNRSGCCDGCVVLAGERLPNQRTLGEDHPEHIPEEQLVAQVPYQGEEAGSIKEVRVTTSAAAKENEEFLDKDAEILRLIEERRSTPKEKKQRIKDLSKRIKNASEKKKE